MAVSLKTVPVPFAEKQTIDTAASSSVQYAHSGAAKLSGWLVDNTANGAKSYIKFYDATGSVTVGTTAPIALFMIPASTSRMFSMPGGITFSTGIAYAVTTAGGTAGTAAPGTALTVRLLISL
jgi:hypothetical protein